MPRFFPHCLALLPAMLSCFLAEAARGAIVFNEIHYHPPASEPGTEFIELHNPDPAAVSMAGWRLEGGVRWTFPPGTILRAGEYLVVAADPDALQRTFQVSAAGPWQGRLRHTGERLILRDARAGVVDELTFGAALPWPPRADGFGSSLELLHPAMPPREGSSWRGALPHPTPGARNSTASERPLPNLDAVAHVPAQPREGEPVRVSAHVVPPPGEKVEVTLRYQIVSPGHYVSRGEPAFAQNWVARPMREGGRPGAGAAREGIYSATVPGRVQTHRTLVRYRVEAQVPGGAKVRLPYPEDAVPNLAWFTNAGWPAWNGPVPPGRPGGVRFPAALMKTLPDLVLLARREEVERAQAAGPEPACAGTLVAEGVVYDHVEFRPAARAAGGSPEKRSWSVRFAPTHGFQAQDFYGRPLRFPWTSLQLCAGGPEEAGPGGVAGLARAAALRAWALGGVPASQAVPVQLRLLTGEAEAPAGRPKEGDFQGLYLAVENPAAEFLQERNLEEGPLLRRAGGTAAPAELEAFLAEGARPQTEAWWREHLNLPAFYSFSALNCLLGRAGAPGSEQDVFYHAPDDAWTVLPAEGSALFRPAPSTPERAGVSRCLEVPALRIEYQNRCRELLDLLATDPAPFGGQFGQIVSEYAAALLPAGPGAGWPELDEARWAPAARPGANGHAAPLNFAEAMRGLTAFATPAPGPVEEQDPVGSGYRRLAEEGADPEAPERPGLEAVGARFRCSPYAGTHAFAAVQYRLGALSPASQPPRQPRLYELPPAWLSPEITEWSEYFQLPASVLRAGQLYRLRVRMKDETGRWSRWSEPVALPAAGRR